MPEQRDLSAPAVAMVPRIFCKGCGYALVGLESSQCPECGRGFDSTNRRTFARRPPRSALWRWGRRVLAVILLLLLAAGTGLGWFWWEWHAEQATLGRLCMLRKAFLIRPIGPNRLRWVLGDRLGFLTRRLVVVDVWSLGAAEIEQLDLGSLKHIHELFLENCEMSNSSLSHMVGLEKLEHLHLLNLSIEKPDLAFLEKLPALSSLDLRGQWVRKTAFEHLGKLGHLKYLSLFQTSMHDADLQQLQGLSSLEELDIAGNPISDDGLEYLQGLNSLRALRIDGRLIGSQGVVKLERAIPGLKVSYLTWF